MKTRLGRSSAQLLILAAACLAMAVGGCGKGDSRPLRVAAAVSLRDVANDLAAALENEFDIEVATAATGTLVRQIEAGAPFDLVLAAAAWPLETLRQDDLLTGDEATVAFNSLVLIAAEPDIDSFNSFAETEGLLAIGDPRYVPAGRYALEVLRQRQLEPAFADRLVYTADVSAIAAHVEAGSARAGIVYSTEARRFPNLTVVESLPTADRPRVVAATLRGPQPELATRALDFLRSDAGQALFRRHGFTT